MRREVMKMERRLLYGSKENGTDSAVYDYNSELGRRTSGIKYRELTFGYNDLLLEMLRDMGINTPSGKRALDIIHSYEELRLNDKFLTAFDGSLIYSAIITKEAI